MAGSNTRHDTSFPAHLSRTRAGKPDGLDKYGAKDENIGMTRLYIFHKRADYP
jgi:hypothetical protein